MEYKTKLGIKITYYIFSGLIYREFKNILKLNNQKKKNGKSKHSIILKYQR